MSGIYVGLGSNLDNPKRQLEQALRRLDSHPVIHVSNISSFYRSQPWGGIDDQPDFINAVCELETQLTPQALLAVLQQIEQIQQRKRTGQKYGPRTIDLDILLFRNICMSDPQLTIPHPRLNERDFVVTPLLEIAPGLILPNGDSLERIQSECEMRGLCVIGDTNE